MKYHKFNIVTRFKYYLSVKYLELNNTEFLSGCRCETQLPKQASIIALTL